VTGAEMEPVEPVLEGRVLGPDEPVLSYRGVKVNADHWPAFAPRAAEAAVRAGYVVWHDEAARFESLGRLDRAGCECESCLGDKYPGEDYY
jgi:hypothetical protein